MASEGRSRCRCLGGGLGGGICNRLGMGWSRCRRFAGEGSVISSGGSRCHIFSGEWSAIAYGLVGIGAVILEGRDP